MRNGITTQFVYDNHPGPISVVVKDQLAKPRFTDFSPDSDTLYGLGWLLLSQGPILMTVPEMITWNRIWVIQATDFGLDTLHYADQPSGLQTGSLCRSPRELDR